MQLLVDADKDTNIERAGKAIAEAAAGGAQLVVLPEIWNSPYSNASFPVAAEDVEGGESRTADALRGWAVEHGIYLVGGSIPERGEGGAVFNTSLVFGPDGSLLGKHRKLHLFDIDIPDGIRFMESETLTAGDSLTVVDTPLLRFGVGICYDLRFPELAALYAARGVHAIVYPGAFNTVTGPLHWELLQRARAVDNNLWVATASPARDETSSYLAWGHSSLVDPSGKVVATTEHDPTIVYGEIDPEEVDRRRQFIPVLDQKRDDLYALIDKTRAV